MYFYTFINMNLPQTVDIYPYFNAEPNVIISSL